MKEKAQPTVATEKTCKKCGMRTPETQVLWWLKRHVGHPQRAAVLSQNEVNT